MEQFATEEQQVEAIKKFWKENGMAIVVGAVLGLGGLYGWRYYNDSVMASKEAASDSYQQAIAQLDTDTTAANAFVQANPDNGYSVLTAMQLAKQAVDAGNLDEAVKHLTFVTDGATDSNMGAVAAIRLARVLAEQANYEQALSRLDTVTEAAFAAQTNETRGDIFVRQQLFDKARAAYSASLESNENNPMLKMKLDNLAVAANG